MFPATFREFDIVTTAARVHGVVGGSGPPLLLLHGMPETHLMWRDVAAPLAERFTVIATDLRGHGGSGAISPGEPDVDYSMRGLALDQVEVMTELGFPRFSVAGHDRGARCAYRLAVDHPERVRRLAVLDIVPTGDAFERANADFALGFWIWSFLAAPSPAPETMILGSPDALVDHMLDTLSGEGFRFPEEVRKRYVDQFRDADRVHAICEQYRSAATIDAARDLEDRDRRPIACPVLALWSDEGAVAAWYEPLDVWGAWADHVEGRGIPGGHFSPEEVPDIVAGELTRFFAAG